MTKNTGKNTGKNTTNIAGSGVGGSNPPGPNEQPPEPVKPDSLEVEALKDKIKRQNDQIDQMKKPKGIASVINKDGHIKRPDEVYNESLPTALGKAGPEELDQAEINALEREHRKFIKRSGGFRKGLTEAQKDRCKKLMKIAGKTKIEWDLSIDIPGFGETHRAGK